LIELGTAAVITVFTYVWIGAFGLSMLAVVLLALWLVALTMLIILFVYDLKWFLLPDVIVFPLIALGAVITGVTLVATLRLTFESLISVVGSIAILGGLYLALWLVSKGMWVGFGDVKLGVALGILLMNWKLALLTLFLANLIGTLVVLPGLLTGKLSRKAQVPFGPFLIVGFFISLVAGHLILNGYTVFTQWLSTVLLML
jgi:leader peptidase (prepilin peptidase)/N-methyltransferase